MAVKIRKELLLIFSLFFITILWTVDEVLSNNLMYEVFQITQIDFLESQYTYSYLHLLTFFPVFFLSFDKKVHYYKEWKHLLPATFIVAIIFILWDVFFTIKGVWGFNHHYLIGYYFWSLPIEEWLFFFTVPFACVFIYECLNAYIKRDFLAAIESKLTLSLITTFLVIGFANWGKMYTATTFTLAGFLLWFHYLWGKAAIRSRFYLAYLVSWLPFMLVNGVLTGAYTQQPIVIYNPEEYLGIRFTSVPLDDSVYSFLLLFSVILLFEYFRKKGTH